VAVRADTQLLQSADGFTPIPLQRDTLGSQNWLKNTETNSLPFLGSCTHIP